MNTFPQILAAVLGLSFLSSCFGQATYRWKEEVQLHDGRVIVIERSVRTGEVPVELGQRPAESDDVLTFKGADGRTITWAGGKPFYPIILDFSDTVPYVVATGRTGTDYERNGCPRPPYFFFRYRNGLWERMRYEEFPRAIRQRNLAANPTYEYGAKQAVNRGLVTLADVKKSHFGLDRFYKEVREDAWNPCAHRGDDFRYSPPNKTGAN